MQLVLGQLAGVHLHPPQRDQRPRHQLRLQPSQGADPGEVDVPQLRPGGGHGGEEGEHLGLSDLVHLEVEGGQADHGLGEELRTDVSEAEVMTEIERAKVRVSGHLLEQVLNHDPGEPGVAEVDPSQPRHGGPEEVGVDAGQVVPREVELQEVGVLVDVVKNSIILVRVQFLKD